MHTSHNIVPCLWFDDDAEAAADLYTRVFPNGRITAVSRYPESGDNPARKPPGSILTVELEVAGQRFTALNGGPDFKKNPSVSFFVNVPTLEDAERIFAALEDDGEVRMPFASYPWSAGYGWVDDRFGVSWQVMLDPGVQTVEIVPCLMFADERQGRAEEAMGFYTRVFQGGRVERVARYEKGEGPEGAIKHGRFEIAGHTMVVMDSHLAHDITFNEAVSLQVMCATQGEIDRYWSELSEGGQQGPCGWLTDRFGVSWQVVPANISRWLTSTDTAARDRAFRAVMMMKKLDIAAIERAFLGAADLGAPVGP